MKQMKHGMKTDLNMTLTVHTFGSFVRVVPGTTVGLAVTLERLVDAVVVGGAPELQAVLCTRTIRQNIVGRRNPKITGHLT